MRKNSPLNGKKLTLYLFTRKEKKASKNRPTSLLSICIKILEFRNIIYYGMFMLFTDNYLIAPNQSRFRLDNQLRAIIQDVYNAF